MRSSRWQELATVERRPTATAAKPSAATSEDRQPIQEPEILARAAEIKLRMHRAARRLRSVGPYSKSSGTYLSSSLMGTKKFTPIGTDFATNPPEVMPMTLPFESSSGPPLLPGSTLTSLRM